MSSETLFETGLLLVLVGFALAFMSALVLVLRGTGSGSKVRGGGIVMIGPIPIIFGTDRGSVKALILLSIVLIVVAFALTWLTYLPAK